jgi:hypothetical protein
MKLPKLDLYKGVILASLVLLPAVGWWIKRTRDTIDATNRAITDATKPGGNIEEIGKLLKQLEVVETNRFNASAQLADPRVYFERQLFLSAQGGIARDAFSFKAEKTDQVTLGKQHATDHIVPIDFTPTAGKKEFIFSRELLFAVLFNCESGFGGEKASTVTSIWKLYSIKATNASLQKEASQQLTPPAEIEDRWLVTNLQFARREPSKR